MRLKQLICEVLNKVPDDTEADAIIVIGLKDMSKGTDMFIFSDLPKEEVNACLREAADNTTHSVTIH